MIFKVSMLLPRLFRKQLRKKKRLQEKLKIAILHCDCSKEVKTVRSVQKIRCWCRHLLEVRSCIEVFSSILNITKHLLCDLFLLKLVTKSIFLNLGFWIRSLQISFSSIVRLKYFQTPTDPTSFFIFFRLHELPALAANEYILHNWNLQSQKLTKKFVELKTFIWHSLTQRWYPWNCDGRA